MIAFDDDSTLIDRLVDGELDNASRAAILAKLDTDPDGWKRCALAFLEAQAWRGAISEHAAPVAKVFVEPKRSRFAWVRPLAKAAAVLMAFSIGWAAKPVREIPKPEVSAPIAESPPEPEPSPAAPSPSYVQGRLEREGYEVEQRQILVPGATEDGMPVVIPVEEVNVRFVGNRAV